MAPAECCGLLVGAARCDVLEVVEIVPCTNQHPTHPERGFRIAPEGLLEASRRARAQGTEVVGAYHSHPQSAARPSAQDAAEAATAWSHVIIGADASITSWRRGRPGAPLRREKVVEI